MLDTGIIRRIDELGRVVVPKEIRKNLSIKAGDSIQIYVNENQIVLKKYEPKRDFTNETFNAIKSLAEITNKGVVFGTLEQVVYSYNLAKDLNSATLSQKMKEVVKQDKNVLLNVGEVIDIEENSFIKYNYQAIMTLKDSNGEIYGFISLLSISDEISSNELNMLNLIVKSIEKNL